MSWVEQIKDEDFEAALVEALPDRPNQSSPFGSGGLSAKQLKEHFDAAVTIVKKKLNDLIDAIAAGAFKVDGDTTLSGLIASIKNGTFANKTLMVKGEGDKLVTLQSLLSALISVVAENESSISELLKNAANGTFASESLMVESVTNGSLVNLRQALVDLLDRAEMMYNLLAESYNDLGEEVYGTDPENPADGTIKKRLNDLKIDLTNLASDLPPREILPEPYTLAKRDGEGRIRTSWHNDEASFKAAPEDEAVAMEDVRQFVPFDFVLHMDENTYVLSFTVKNARGETRFFQQVDLPLESVWVAAAYDAATKSIVLTTRDGNTVSVDVTAITGGLVNRDDFEAEMAKKVDKITEAWRAYTTDANGNTVSKPLAAKPSAGGVVLYNEGGILKTNAPVADNDAANKQFVEAGLAGKVDATLPSEVTAEYAYMISPYGNSIRRMSGVENTHGNIPSYRRVDETDRGDQGGTINVTTPKFPYNAVNKKFVEDGFLAQSTEIWALYGTGSMNEATGKAVRRMVKTTAIGTKDGYVANFRPVDAKDFDYDPSIIKCTIGVCDPIKPIQAANKRYVDGKVDPIANDVAVIWDALGGAIEYASIDSTTNPVTVPANALSEATLDKIGTGIKTEVINEAFTKADPSEVTGVLSATCIRNGVYRLNGTVGDEPARATFTLTTPIDTSEGETIYVSAELLSGSIVDRNGNPSSVRIGIYSPEADWLVGEQSTVVGRGSPISEFTINFQYEPVSFIDAIIAIHIGKQKQTYGVPVASVKKGAETIYTVPEAIRSLAYTDRPDPNDALPVYGLAMSDTVYNYLDLEKKQYVVKCQQNFVTGELMETNAAIDVSEYLTDEDGEITVAAGDEILFADTDGNSAGSTVPSTITYIVKKGASQ